MAKKEKLLTRPERRLLGYLAAAERTGSHPTYREIGEALGWRSPGTVSGHLRELVRRGWVKSPGGRARDLQLTAAGRAMVAKEPPGPSLTLPPFPKLDPKEREIWERLLPFLTRRRFPPGRILWREQTEEGHLVLLERGHVQVHRMSPTGRKVALLTFGPGDAFGFLPLLDGGLYPATAETVDEVQARVLSRSTLLETLRFHPEFALALVRMLGRRLRESFDRVEELSMRGALPRVASGLVALLPEQKKRGGLTVIDLPTSGRDFAEGMGLTPETLSRVITRLEADRIVHRMGVRRLQVLDVEALHRVAVPARW